MIPDLKRPRLNNHHWFMVRTVGRIIFDGSVSELNDGTYGLHNALSMAAGMMDDNESVNRVEIYSSVKNPPEITPKAQTHIHRVFEWDLEQYHIGVES